MKSFLDVPTLARNLEVHESANFILNFTVVKMYSLITKGEKQKQKQITLSKNFNLWIYHSTKWQNC